MISNNVLTTAARMMLGKAMPDELKRPKPPSAGVVICVMMSCILAMKYA
jgi:hypothetical protein